MGTFTTGPQLLRTTSHSSSLLCAGEQAAGVVKSQPEYEPRPQPPAGLPADSVDRNDVGLLVQRVLNGGPRPTDAELREALESQWKPDKQSDYPVSYHRKNCKWRCRSLGPQHLQQFEWLAVSRLRGVNGAWCTFCALFKTTKEGGGRAGMHGIGGNMTMGRLVNQPLRDFSDLTGQNGCLNRHAQTEFHKACAIRVA